MSDTYIPGGCCHKKYKPTAFILFGCVWKNPTTTKTSPQSSKQSSGCHTPNWILRHESGWRSCYPVKPCKVHKHFTDILYTPISIMFPLSGPFPVLIHVFVSLLLLMALLFLSESTRMTAADRLKLIRITHILKSRVSSNLQHLCDVFLVK